MDVGIQKYPIKFINYGLRDAIVLKKIMKEALKGFNNILEESIPNIRPDQLFTLYNMPMTIGTLVNVVFSKFIDGVMSCPF